MTKKIGLIADIHANHISLKISLEMLENEGVDAIICAGDIVGYGADPNAVISLLRRKKIKSVIGNHDLSFMVDMQQKYESQWPIIPEIKIANSFAQMRPVAVKMLQIHVDITNETNSKWISSLPLFLDFPDMELFMIHGAPPMSLRKNKHMELNYKDYLQATMQYLFPSETQFLEAICMIQPQPVMTVGHTHQQFAYQTKGLGIPPLKVAYPCVMNYSDFPVTQSFEENAPILVNSGSVGQSRDNVKAPGFAILIIAGNKKKKRTITWYRYKYSFAEYQEALLKIDPPKMILTHKFWHISDDF